MAVNDIFRVTMYTKFRDQVAVNVLHYYQSITGPVANPTPEYLQGVADAFNNGVVDEFIQCLSQESSFLGIKVRHLAPLATNDFEVSDVNGASPGQADAAGTAPSQVCGLIRKRGPYAARRSRGRMYVPFPPIGVINQDDLITNAYRTLLNALAAAVQGTLLITTTNVTTTLAPCLINASRPFVITPVIQADVASGFATQRRRGYFGKPNAEPVL